MPIFSTPGHGVWRGGIAALLLLSTLVVRAQEVPPTRTPVFPVPAPLPSDSALTDQEAREFATPSVVGQGPSKGVVAHLERLSDFSIKSKLDKANGGTTSTATVTKNSRAFIKGYIPAWNRPHLKVILGFNYDREEFQFNRPDNAAFFRNLEDKGLKVLGAQLAVIRPIDDVHWYIARVKGELNGDYTASELDVNDYLKMSGEFIYGWKRSKYFAWGVGLQLGYTFGRQSVYPAILYNRTFNDRWGLEALFPARVSVRYNVSEKTLLFAGYSVDGLNYNIKLRQPLPNGRETLILRETELRPRLRLEREIYDFLWFGVEAGYRYNASFAAFDEDGNSGNSILRGGSRPRIIDNTLGGAPYASLEVFLVPPRKFLKKTLSK